MLIGKGQEQSQHKDMDMGGDAYLLACRLSQEEVARPCALPQQIVAMPPGLHAEVPLGQKEV